MSNISCKYVSLNSFCLIMMIVASSFFITFVPNASADIISPNSEITLLDQNYSTLAVIPDNMVLGNNLDNYTDTTLTYNSAAGAIEYKRIGDQVGPLYVGIEPFINGNLSISLKVNSDNWNSNMYIIGSTFYLQAQTLSDGGARVFSHYSTSADSYIDSYQYYDVPVSAQINGVNTINIMISGTTKSLTVYHDSAHKMTTPLSYWSVQNLPYDPITLPTLMLVNERSSLATWVSTLLYGIRETANGGLVSAIPGNDFVPFGIDAPRDYANSNGTQYMSSTNQKGVAWADVGYLTWEPKQKDYINSLLDAGWELGIHYDISLDNLPIAQAYSVMQDQYNQIKEIFGRPPTSWCSFQDADNVTHAIFAYNQLGMIWRNGVNNYIANINNLEEWGWPAFWSKISNAQIIYPSYTHSTDALTAPPYAIGYVNFTKWIDNYNGKHMIGGNEYYHRILNQVDTKTHYLNYIQGVSLKFTIECNEFQSRLMINFPMAENAVVLKNGSPLVKNSDYFVDNNCIVLFSESNVTIEILASGVPDAPGNLQATAGNAQVTLSWNIPSYQGPGTLIYHLFRDNVLVWSGTTVTHTDNGLTNGQPYMYEVSASNDVGGGPYSTAILTTPMGLASEPRGLTASPGDGFVDLTWSAPSSNGGASITNYKIYRGTISDGETLLMTVGNVLTHIDTGLTNGQIYYYRVSAVNVVGESPLSNEASTTPVTMPAPPTLNSATAGNAQIVLSWSAPSSDGGNAITNFKVYRSTISGEETLLMTVGNVLTYTDTVVSNGQIYYYKISAVNAVGEGAKSNEASATPFTVPSVPLGLVATAGNAKVTLSWSAPSSNGGVVIDYYVVYRNEEDAAHTSSTTYTDQDLTNGQSYSYYVRAHNAAGLGSQSDWVSTTPYSTEIVVTSPAADVIWYKNTTYIITWNANVTGNVRIELFHGSTLAKTIAASTANDGTQNWMVPFSMPVGSGYQVKISSVTNLNDFAIGPGKVQISNPVVTVTNPTATSLLVAGSKLTVSWTSAGTIPGLKVQLIKDGLSILTLTKSTANDGNQVFTLPFNLEPGNDYSIRITDKSNAAVTDDSEGFTIRTPVLTVIYPNDGETLVVGASVNIRWTGDMTLLGKVSIALWQNGQLVLTLSSSTANDGSFIWSSNRTLASGTGYSIRITSVNHPEFYDESNSAFSVRKPILAITSPLTGASFTRSSTIAINWQKDPVNIGAIRIELYRNGVLSRVIISSTNNDGVHSWKIPSTQAIGAYQIKITSNNDSTIFAWSGTFSIT